MCEEHIYRGANREPMMYAGHWSRRAGFYSLCAHNLAASAAERWARRPRVGCTGGSRWRVAQRMRAVHAYLTARTTSRLPRPWTRSWRDCGACVGERRLHRQIALPASKSQPWTPSWSGYGASIQAVASSVDLRMPAGTTTARRLR
jgi:hypothetical protein